MKFQEVILRGLRAAQPAASSVPIGTLYYVTDELQLERSNGTTWDSYSGNGAVILTDLGLKFPRPTYSSRKGQAAIAQDATNFQLYGFIVQPVNTSVSLATNEQAWGFYRKNSVSTTINTHGRTISPGSNFLRTRFNPLVEFDILTGPDISGMTSCVGVSNVLPPTGTTGLNGHYAMFRYVAGTDTNWVAITNNGSIANQTANDTGVVVAIDTRYRMRIEWSLASVIFSINDIVVHTENTIIPEPGANQQILWWVTLVNLIGGAGSGREISIGSIYQEQD